MSESGSRAARERVIEAMERSAAEYGLPRSSGRVYGHLYFAEGPLSLDDLVERTGYAKSTVSDAASVLEDVHLAYRRSPPGSGRRAYFEPERDLWYALRRIAEESGGREIEQMRRALEAAESALADAEGAETDLERVRDLQATYRQAAVALDLFQRLPVRRVLGILARFADDVDEDDLPDGVDVPDGDSNP